MWLFRGVMEVKRSGDGVLAASEVEASSQEIDLRMTLDPFWKDADCSQSHHAAHSTGKWLERRKCYTIVLLLSDGDAAFLTLLSCIALLVLAPCRFSLVFSGPSTAFPTFVSIGGE